MAQKHEWMFYELMWRAYAQGEKYPLPWWVQMYFRAWRDSYDGGLFASKEAAFSSNANYRYWSMVGVKNSYQECLIGQAGEIEPVYDNYSLLFFLFDSQNNRLYFPQYHDDGSLSQQLSGGFRPFVQTLWDSSMGIRVEQTVFGTVLDNGKDVALCRFHLIPATTLPAGAQPHLGLAIVPWGPTGFQRIDRAGRDLWQRKLTALRCTTSTRLQINDLNAGPVFSEPPVSFGLYGNDTIWDDPEHYIRNSPFKALADGGLNGLNGWTYSQDNIAGMCTGAFMFNAGTGTYDLDVILPVGDFLSADDLATLDNAPPTASALETASTNFWNNKLTNEGLQFTLSENVSHLTNLFRVCRSNLLILTDDGEIHPGPTIYDSFWIRDSAIEGIAVALAGDYNIAHRQFGFKYPDKFNMGSGTIGPVREYGLFAGEHEKEAWEWDANGQALWAIGRFDRIHGSGFGSGMFYPYIIEGSRWLRDNRDQYGLLHRGWSAEHIGGRDKPHYWDDMWALAGLWEAAQVAQRYNKPEISEIWNIYDQVRDATQASIHWVLNQQESWGIWETFIPTGPADAGLQDSSMIGTLAYFHPCRLYMGSKLGSHIDWAARMTLDTIYGHFVDGGLRHDSAWRCYGPYLTLQLAHCYLLLGNIDRMDQLLFWTVGNAGYSHISRTPSDPDKVWDVTQGAWNEQHCYPISKNFNEDDIPDWWYMGDIPHGWACAEMMLLLRDILFFEAAEDSSDPHIYIAPGVMPHWLPVNTSCTVEHAPTIFNASFGFILQRKPSNNIVLEITEAPANISYRYQCRFGTQITDASVLDGSGNVTVSGTTIQFDTGIRKLRILFR